MNKRLVVLAILLIGFCLLSIVYAMGGSAPSTKEIAIETFAPGTYKTYKNDFLGFSFKYPKDWFIEEPPPAKRSSPMAVHLTNFDFNKMPTIPEEKQFDVTCSADQNYYEEAKAIKNIHERMFYVADRVFRGLGVKRVGILEEINVKGGKFYLVRTIGIGTGKKGKKCDIGLTYLTKEENEFLIRFFPYQIPDRGTYLKIIRSSEIY